jgi:predicted house-cleaning noncanonical NTP pyrophosphatase (MazG superfamily)
MKKEKYFYAIVDDDEMEHVAQIADTLTECAQWLNVSKQAIIKARAKDEAIKHYKIHKIKE